MEDEDRESEEFSYDDDDDEKQCPGCGRATTGEYCPECQEDGTEFLANL